MLGFDRNALFTVWFTPQEWMHEASFSSGQTLGGQNTSIFKFTPPRPSKSGHEHASRAGGAPGVGPGLGNSRQYRIHTYADCIHTSRAARGAPMQRPPPDRARAERARHLRASRQLQIAQGARARCAGSWYCAPSLVLVDTRATRAAFVAVPREGPPHRRAAARWSGCLQRCIPHRERAPGRPIARVALVRMQRRRRR